MRVRDRNDVRDVWVEAQIDTDGIALTLLSESGGVGAVVESVEYFTFDELQDMSGEMFRIRLSDNAREVLSDMGEDASIGRMLQSDNLAERADDLPENPTPEQLLTYMGLTPLQSEEEPDLPAVGQLVRDTDPPEWSDGEPLMEVVGIPGTTAGEYAVEERRFSPDTTVADLNPKCDPDEPVVECVYPDNQDTVYAFPLSRIREEQVGN